eukprot:TRINITY_DN4107_c0_g1_i1.p1 TRINITY_DN4107_c0_g1~~TRINITY_DN4107_c0_g1_i1.p1  ORF type:complete len:304 (-),score=62.31 TRINITY_DN4107_c0_g1_i1:317-1228(-)
MSLFGFGSSHKISFEFDPPADVSTRSTIAVAKENGAETLPLFHSTEGVSGRVVIAPQSGKKIEHLGIRLELIGQIELFYDRGNQYEFASTLRELSAPGVLSESKTYPFEFASVEKVHESYSGINVRLRYFLRVTIVRQYATNIVKEQDFWVQVTAKEPEINNSIKMEVGIEDCLHIEFEYNKSKYHLKDVVVGKVYFLLVRVKIKHMEVAIIKRESTGSGANIYNESETITKFEIMDGAPVRGESIPVRLFLSPYHITPTYRQVNNKFSVRYYLNLVLVDEEDRRYFKQQEITLWRKEMSPSV